MLVTREPAHFDLANVSARSIAGFVYLTTIGSLVGFTAYIWLLTVQPASRVSTYAYVNPVIAVLLGWLSRAKRCRFAPRLQRPSSSAPSR